MEPGARLDDLMASSRTEWARTEKRAVPSRHRP